MTPGQFLRLVWPSTGFYCITHPFTPAGSNVTVHAQRVFPTISEAVTHVHETRESADVFFAVLSLREAKVWDPDKEDPRTGEKGAWAVRLQTNMLAARCLFFDLDVGSDPTKYPTQRDALAGLIQFLKITGLPMPTLVSSGGGVHVYWHFDQDMPAIEWRDLAFNMRQLAEKLGLRIDPTRTIDTSSVLRVPDTFNYKGGPENRREVRVLQEGAVTPLGALQRMISDACIAAGVQPGMAPVKTPAAPSVLGEQRFNDFGPPPTLGELGNACAQVREMVKTQVGSPYVALDNTAWYRGMLATISHVEGGDDHCRQLTARHPRDNADIETKLLQLKQFPPARCETLRQFMPWKDAPCQGCRAYPGGQQDPSIPNPLALARRTTPAPPPGAAGPAAPTPPPAASGPSALLVPPAPIGLVSPTVTALMIPNPPKPYERLKTGGIAITRKDKDGNESTSVIYAHDLYPLRRLVNNEAGVEQQVWRATLPRSGAKEFTIDADVLYDARRFSSAVSHAGLYPNKADLPALQDYMVAYISQLQRDLDADQQVSHLGWSDGYRQFTLPDRILLEDGTVKMTSLTEGAAKATQFIGRRGDLASSIALLAWYNRPEYLANQFAILCGLGSVIFHATGNHGIVVNMSGESGASKSTTLYTLASLWGDPALWPINGTNRGATANARSQRVVTNANLPTPVDEITHLPSKEAIDLVMNITQPGHRLRLGTDGNEKSTGDGYKSAIMVSTANSSLHALLSTDNAAGTAGSMRVFEMKMAAPRVHTKAEADEFLRQIKQNFGHIGPAFVEMVVRHRVAVEKRVQQLMREIDAEANIQSSERFWSAAIAVVIAAGELAKAMGLIAYDIDAIRRWAVTVQVPFMRGVVKEEYRDPLAVLTDYIAEKHGNIVVVERSTVIGTNTTGQPAVGEQAFASNHPHGALLGHYDQRNGILYLLKQGFKDHCSKIGATSSRILDELNLPRAIPSQAPRRIITDRAVRRTLGAGTNLAKGQAWCFSVDMTHPDIAGAAPPVMVSTGGGVVTPTPPAGKLSVVK